MSVRAGQAGMGRETVHTDDAPPAVADYNRATVTDGLSFTAGQVAPTPDGEPPAGEPVDVRARQVLENLEAALSSADSGLGSAVNLLPGMAVEMAAIATEA